MSMFIRVMFGLIAYIDVDLFDSHRLTMDIPIPSL